MAGVRVPVLYKIERCGLCAWVWGAALLVLASAAANAAPIACAIRWDAWYTTGPRDPGAYTAKALSVPPWRDRTPLHAHFDNQGRISWAPSQETFDAEIRAAAKAHLCWVYLAYGDHGVIDLDHPMMRGLWFHRRSSLRGEVDYALMTSPSLLVGGSREAALVATLQLLKDENYQRIIIAEESRPLIFLYLDASQANGLPTNAQPLREALVELRAGSERRGLGNPYVVVTLSGAKQAESVRASIGADAISQYVAGRQRGRQSWAQFEPSIEADWDLYAAATSADVVPTLRSGADIRARCQTPPPFDHRFPPGSPCDDFVFNPTLEELEQEFRHARAWIDMRRARDPAALMLVYAWSECDESGNCLMPTYGDPLGRKLDAITRALAR